MGHPGDVHGIGYTARMLMVIFGAGLHSTPALHTLLERRHHQAQLTRTVTMLITVRRSPGNSCEPTTFYRGDRPLSAVQNSRARLRAPAVISGQRSIEAILQEIEEEATTYPEDVGNWRRSSVTFNAP